MPNIETWRGFAARQQLRVEGQESGIGRARRCRLSTVDAARASASSRGRPTDRFVAAIKAFAKRHRTPIVEFKRGEREDDVATEHLGARLRLAVESRRSAHAVKVALLVKMLVA